MTIVQGRKLWVGSYDLSGDLQGISFGTEIEMEDDTVLPDDTRSNAPGLQAFTIEERAIWSAGPGTPDLIASEHKGLSDVLATLGPVDDQAGSLAYFFQTTQGAFSKRGQVGTLLRFDVSLMGSGGAEIVRGTLMEVGAKSSTGNGTARQLGSVSASQFLYAGMHVTAVSGTNPTLDVTVESDSADDFSGAETTRITFGQKTAVGSEWATPIAGAITDDWWRIAWTIGGTGSPSFTIALALGIQ